LFSKTAFAIEYHPFIYLGGTFVDNSTKNDFVKTPTQRYTEELLSRQTMGLSIVQNKYALSLSTNRLFNKPIQEQIELYNKKFDIITKQYQDNITLSYKLNEYLGLNTGIAFIDYQANIPNLKYQSDTKFYAFSVGFNLKLTNILYLMFSYSPHQINTYKKEHTDYYGVGLVLYYF
jgi:hypothetical protein